MSEEELKSIDTSVDTEGDLEILIEFGEFTRPFRESREIVKDRDKRITHWGLVRRTAKQTRLEPNPSPE
jgi:hypothetical protein